ncbi:MAG: HK97 gp10 family phage protein [Candidatus Heimdallarchaeaceae archaeon]
MITVSRYIGLDKVSKKLQDIERRMPELSEKILKEASWRLKKSAIMRAPKDTGKLRSTIRAKVFTWEAHVFAGGTTTMRTVGKGQPFDYAVAQEFGFSPHVIHKSLWMGKTPPKSEFVTVSRYKPFMAPALKQYLIKGLKATIKKYTKQIIR